MGLVEFVQCTKHSEVENTRIHGFLEYIYHFLYVYILSNTLEPNKLDTFCKCKHVNGLTKKGAHVHACDIKSVQNAYKIAKKLVSKPLKSKSFLAFHIQSATSALTTCHT